MSSSRWCAWGLTRVVGWCRLHSWEQNVGFLKYGGSGPWWDLEGGCKQKVETHLLSFSPLVQRNPPKLYSEPSGNCTLLIYSYLSVEKKKIVSFQRRLVKMPNAACFWHFQLLLNNSLASVTANVDLKAVVHFSTQMLSRQAWVLTNIFLGLPKASKNELLVNSLF